MEPGHTEGGYVFQRKLGQGGMAEVWEVKSTSTSDALAVKLLLPEHCTNPRIRVRFEREGHIRLVHPNIVPVLRLEEFENRPALIMPLYLGGSLEPRIRKTAAERESGIGMPLEIQQALVIADEILGALDFANQEKVIHRDVKPDNILFDSLGHANLSDFGIALDMKRIAVTEAGGDLGTALYASPEQIQHPKRVDHRTDVYSFGCCLYDMLAGRPPFVSTETDARAWTFNLQMAHVKEQPPYLRQFNDEVSEELSDIVMASIAKNPEDRLPGCREFARRLKEVQQQAGARDATIRAGDRISGYLFQRKLGQGGMAEVWEVKTTGSEEEFAVKILLPEYLSNAKVHSRFVREGELAGAGGGGDQLGQALSHPNIVRVLKLQHFRGRPGLVMRLYRGGSLESRIRKTAAEQDSGIGKPLPVKEALAISKEILAALEYANGLHVIHRDVKPDNVLFDGEGHPHLADFGIALDMKRVAITEAGGDLGTALYISPEQIRNPRTVDSRADVYSFGCCLFDMLTGRPPFISDELDDAAWSFNLRLAHVNDPPPPVRSLNPNVSTALSDAAAKALYKAPDRRFAGCGEFARELERVGPVTPRFPWLESLKERRQLVSTLAIAALLALGLLIGGKELLDWMLHGRESPGRNGNAGTIVPEHTNPGAGGRAENPPPGSGGGTVTAPPAGATGATGGQLGGGGAVNPGRAGGKEARGGSPGKNVAKGGSAAGSDRKAGDADHEQQPASPGHPNPPPGNRVTDAGAAVSTSSGAEREIRFRAIDSQTQAPIQATLVIDDKALALPQQGRQVTLTDGAPYSVQITAPGYKSFVNRSWRATGSDVEVRLSRQ